MFGLLYQIGGGNRQWKFLLGVAFIYNMISIGVSSIVARMNVDHVVLITAPQEWPLELFIWGVLVPFVFWLYLTLLPESLRDLSTLAKEGKITLHAVRRLNLMVSSRAWVYFSIAILVLVVGLYHAIFIPAEINSAPLISFWYATWWTKIIVTILLLTVFYVGVQVILKTLAMGWIMRSFLEKHDLKRIELFHPDGCGGLRKIGKIAVRVSYLALLIGIWTVWLTVLPWIRGGHPNFSLAILVLYGAYVSLAPMILFSILWPTHQAMRQYKERVLYDLGKRLQELVETSSRTQDSKGAFQEIVVMYDLVKKAPEWPISSLNALQFGGISALPGLLGTVSFIVDFLGIKPIWNLF